MISGPSGVGKSTLVNDIIIIYGSQKMAKAVSHTTRPARKTEINHQDYHFVSRETFEQLKNQKAFVEWARVYYHYYGTSFQSILQHWNHNKAVITDLDIQGADSIKKYFPHSLRIFILPPSMEALQNRIQIRNTDNKEDVEYRQKAAEQEMQKAKEFDHQVINQHRSTAVKKIKSIIDQYLQSILNSPRGG